MIVINTQTVAVSEYSLAWTEVVEFAGVIYGLTSTGISKLSGALESTADPRVKTGKMILSQDTAHTAHPAILTVASEGVLRLSATRDVDGIESTAHYSVPVVVNEKRRDRLVPMGRGVKANAWSFEIGPAPGEDSPAWSISSMTVEVPAIKLPLK